jgi:hypothetical protein
MTTRSAHIRLASVDGRKVRGVRKPPSKAVGARPLPSFVIDQANGVWCNLDHAEKALRTLFDLLQGDKDLDAVVVRALVRDTMINLSAGNGQAKWLAQQLDDPAWLWR